MVEFIQLKSFIEEKVDEACKALDDVRQAIKKNTEGPKVDERLLSHQ